MLLLKKFGLWSKELKNIFLQSQRSKPGVTQRNLPLSSVQAGPVVGLGWQSRLLPAGLLWPFLPLFDLV